MCLAGDSTLTEILKKRRNEREDVINNRIM